MGWKNVKEHYQIKHLVQIRRGVLCVGSSYCPELIQVDCGFNVTKSSLIGSGEELGRIYKAFKDDEAKLRKLIESPDKFERSLTVYTYAGRHILEKQCETYGWPNITHDGEMMYENTFSTERDQVIQWAIKNARAGIQLWRDAIKERQESLDDALKEMAQDEADLAALEANRPVSKGAGE